MAEEIEEDNDICSVCNRHDCPCSTCHGDREVDTMEQVWAGEPHVAPIGTSACTDCCSPDEEEDQDN